MPVGGQMKKYLYLILFFLVCVPAIAGTIDSYTLKSPPDDADLFVIRDSDDGSTKKVQIGDISGGASSAAGWTDAGTNVHNTSTSDNVAIGTTTPTSKLTVVGNIGVAGSVSSTGTESYIEFSELSSDPDTPESGKGKLFQRDDNHVYYIDDDGTVTDLVSVGAGLEWASATGKIYPTTLTDNVGIGTTITGAKLAIKSPGSTGAESSFLQLANSYTAAMTLLDEPSSGKPRIRMRDASNPNVILAQIDMSGDSFIVEGNIGMGTSLPSGKFDVKGSDFPVVFMERSTSATNSMSGIVKIKNTTDQVSSDGLGAGMSFFMQDSGGSDSELGSIGFVRNGADNTGAFSIRPSTTGTPAEKMVIKANGNVGVGTETPREVLDVIGTVRASGYKSSDGTAGATVTTCTGFKNGLCISGS